MSQIRKQNTQFHENGIKDHSEVKNIELQKAWGGEIRMGEFESPIRNGQCPKELVKQRPRVLGIH